MTVSTTGVRLSFIGNGVTTSFPCTGVPARAATDYVVELQTGTADPVLQTLGTHYTVSGTFPGEGTINFVTAPPAGTTVLVRRSTPALQTLDLEPARRWSAEGMERALDRLTKRVQELEELLLGVPKIPYHLRAPGADPGTRFPLPQTGHLLVGVDGVGWQSQDATAFLASLGIVPGGGGGGGGGLTWPLLAPAGSASAPSYSWSGSPTLGFYRDGERVFFARNGNTTIELGVVSRFGMNGLENGLLNIDAFDRTDGALTLWQASDRPALVLEGSGTPTNIELIPNTGRVLSAGLGERGVNIMAPPYSVAEGGDVSAAIAAAISAGEKRIVIPAGNFVWNNAVTVPARTQIVGAGSRATTITVASSISGPFLTFDLNTDPTYDTDWCKSLISGFTFSCGGASGIRVLGHEVELSELAFYGGAAGGWAIDCLNVNEIFIHRIVIGKGGGSAHDWLGNGIRYRLDRGTPDGKAVNFGDGSIRDVTIKLKSANSIGIELDGSGYSPTSGTGKPLINNLLLSGITINSGNKPANSIGIKLRQVQRCTFHNIDIELLEYGWHLSSPYTNGNPGSNQYNTFVGCYCLNCTYEWADFGDTLDGGSQPASLLRSHFLGCFFVGPRGSDATPDYGFALGDENGTYSAKGSPVDIVLGGTLWFTLPSSGQMQTGLKCSQQGRFLMVGDINYSPNPGSAPYDGAFKNDKPRKAIGFDFGINEVRIYKPWGTAEGTDARLTIGNGPNTTGLSGAGSPATPLHHIKLADPVYLERWDVAKPSGGSVPGYGANVPDIMINAANTAPLGTLQDWSGPGIYTMTEEPGGSFRWVRVGPRPGFIKAQLLRSGTSYTLTRSDAGKFAEHTPSDGTCTITIPADLISAEEQTNAAGYSTAFVCWIASRSGAGYNVVLSADSGVTMYKNGSVNSVGSVTLAPGEVATVYYIRTGAGTATVWVIQH